MEKEWYIYLYIDDIENHASDVNPRIEVIRIKKNKSKKDLLLKIHKKEIENKSFFIDVFEKLNGDVIFNSMNRMFIEYNKTDLDENLKQREQIFMLKYGLDIFYWLNYDSSDEILKKKFQIAKKIYNEEMSKFDKIEIMEKLERCEKIIIKKADEWQREKEELEKKIRKLEEKLKYTPGNEGYFEAMLDFDNQKKINLKKN